VTDLTRHSSRGRLPEDETRAEGNQSSGAWGDLKTRPRDPDVRPDGSVEPSSVDVARLVAHTDLFCRAFGPHGAVASDEAAVARFDVLCRALSRAEADGLDDRTIRAIVRPAARLLGGVPIIRRVQTWPRGRACDHVSMDMLWTCGSASDLEAQTALLGRCVLNRPVLAWMRERVLWRQHVLATCVRPSMRVLFAGCGGGRELATACVKHGFSLVLADEDDEALDKARARVPHALQPHIVHASLADLPQVIPEYGPFDLILWGDVIDVMPDVAVETLIRRMSALLAAGGQMALGGLTANRMCRAWMHHLADWRVHYRSAADLGVLLTGIAHTQPDLRMRVTHERAADGGAFAGVFFGKRGV
jgi:hypothetical protein